MTPSGPPPAAPVHVSITGLRVTRPWLLPRFWWHTLRILRAARAAPGNLGVRAGRIGGVHHTLTVWATRADMAAFLRGRSHRGAMAGYPFAGQGRVAGFAAGAAPDWADVPALLAARGRDV